MQGDSGGPLFCHVPSTSDSDWTLIGVTSWGSEDCDITYPSVNTRISYYRQWIHQQSGI